MSHRMRALVVAVLLAALLPTGTARAATEDRLVSDFPVLGTPHAMNGAVYGIAQVGDRIVVVGSFTRVSPAATYHRPKDDLVRRGIFAFDARTGAIDRSFRVSLGGGQANAVDTDGTHLFVGGDFTSVNGRTRHARLVKLTAGGRVVGGFRARPDDDVDTLVVRGARVYVGGSFTHVGPRARSRLAAVATSNGAVLASVQVPFTGVYTSRVGGTSVKRIDVTADGRRLVAIGNFARVGGRPRVQVAVLDVSGRARVTGWRTSRFDARHNDCHREFGSFVRDVDLAPGGGWFVVATTGGYSGGIRSGTLCDTTSRWSIHRGRNPAWVAYTGGDTTNGVEVARGAVYVGGHMRWENNPYAADQAGPGAVPRQGLAALDPVTGLPLSWNPGRTRGVGAQAFLATPDGLWIGSDTTLLANQRRGRIALMPWEGGRRLPQAARATLPNDLFVAPRASRALRVRHLDRSGEPTGATRRVGTGLDWSQVRGAFYVDGEVFYGRAGGGLVRRGFDPVTGELGRRHLVSTRGLPFPVRRLTGMFYETARHRLYYTLAQDRRLHYRAFSVESAVLGAVGHVASRDPRYARVAGMTLAGGRVLYGSRDGVLRSVRFRGGRAVGEPVRLSSRGPWRARALFVPND